MDIVVNSKAPSLEYNIGDVIQTVIGHLYYVVSRNGESEKFFIDLEENNIYDYTTIEQEKIAKVYTIDTLTINEKIKCCGGTKLL